LQALCQRLGIAERVTFVGHLDRSSLAERYRRASVFVLPALSDAMPNAALEAMASGLALIATPGGAGDLIRDNGFVIAPRDPSSIRRAVARYLADRQLLAAHKERSRALALSMSWQAVAEYFIELNQAMTDDCRQPRIEPARHAAVRDRSYERPASVD
jgi:glycosyltransferase involved in cell wall biosynthesis